MFAESLPIALKLLHKSATVGSSNAANNKMTHIQINALPEI